MISRTIALLLFIILLPFFLLIGLTIFLTDGRPILFTQRRIGQHNREFILYKFRTMKKDTPDLPTHLLKDPEKHLLPIGKTIRKFSLDELPNLLNIIKGQMKFIGPRPALYNQDDLISLRTQAGVHTLKPGITGWAQVNGRDELTIPEKVRHDAYYLHHQSFTLNVKIMYLTIINSFLRKGVAH